MQLEILKKLVSICIPTYKQTEYLKKCLESLLAQDFKDYELIISDDTPDDSIEQFLKTILKDHSYSYTRNIPALGMPENWNSAIKKAEGKYIKIKYCVQLPTPSPQFVFFCNLPQYVKEPYKRFTENQLRKHFGFTGVPIEVYFRQK